MEVVPNTTVISTATLSSVATFASYSVPRAITGKRQVTMVW